MEKPSLKSAQLQAIHNMLSLNDDGNAPASSTSHMNFSSAPAGTSYNQWKILIYDKPCRSIISPLLSVSQLRARGVTLHLLISTERESIPDVPAVYFVEPTRANLSIIAEDCAKRLYSKVHINFVTKLDRSLMEEFGKLIVQANCLDMIASLHDQYLDFICLERNLFSLSNKSDSYAMMNGRGVTGNVMENYLDEIAFGLLSVVGCTGSVPVIRCPRGGAPEMVARKVNKLIAEHPSTSTNKAQHNRPLLVILDRNMDLITPIQHSSTYQALIDDLLSHNANRVEFTVNADNGRPSQKKFDLDADEDPFYSKYKFNPFPEAIESNGEELEEVTSRENAIRSKAVGGDDNDNNNATSYEGDVSNAASDLASAVDSLPKLLEQKKQLEMHTSILQAVMNEVAARDVPQFFELESDLASGKYKSDAAKAKNEVLTLVTDPFKGNVEDNIRLVIVFCLATTAPGSDVTEVASAMAEALESKGSSVGNSGGAHGLLSKEDRSKLEKGLKAIEYLKNLRSLQMIPNITESEEYSTKSSANSDMLSSFMTRATNQATGLLAKATEKVSSMIGKISKHRATRVVESLCEMKPNSEDDEYLYLDPKVRGDVDVQVLRNMSRAPYREIITFVIGGGCYAEYQNLQMIANDRRIVTYGSTEIVSPCDFLSQLGKLS
uniref:Sec1 family domain-containing protein 1 n=1 Tax=Chaetoceros debilis TaxID=122233 RepID=A0A7S3Q1I0_9STRA|mmetsp:Transcript_7612/g.10946  ORF Transcript_7612/g.10946 Transcript_7612/m.10946 type:complete len:665 (+) Transcript_7612:143-2137(+)|eukprot:CAMPEP_0194082890 /NCGR_PEP_ID=MMETSP0149-20130528/8291_1 /TAXON_ID=122233 /ORGANISM="Chaetoceros debilis, Strain MM31A-1" /LENGTH=664 /DNA_ID=CAMNT_0038765165 /DNA_START=98 /DNA_END=2092 /DNA_ORIENTATION=+